MGCILDDSRKVIKNFDSKIKGPFLKLLQFQVFRVGVIQISVFWVLTLIILTYLLHGAESFLSS